MSKHKEIKVEDFIIGENHKPFIIAEMSGNHNQSIDRALEIVDAAAEAGAHALKLQTYTADTITFNGNTKEFFVGEKTSLWAGESLHNLYSKAYTPWEWHKTIFDHAKSKGMIAFSSPFDTTAVDFLENLNVPIYKIASFENTDHILLKKVAQTGKPVIMSTGIATVEDIEESVKVLRANGCKDLILLKCTSTYPASPQNTNLNTIPDLRDRHDVVAGLSDHTMGIGCSVAAIALGARVIEKHFTLSRADGGVDSSFSLEPSELKALVEETERAFLGLGKVSYELSEGEKANLQFKRSLYVVENIKKGEQLTPQNVRSIRPGLGLHTRYYDDVLGQIATKDISAGTPLAFNLISKQ